MIPLARSATAVRSLDSNQFVRLKTRKSAQTGNRQAHRGHGVRVGQVEDRRAVVLPEHPVVRLKSAPSRLRHLADDSGLVRGLRNEPSRCLAGEAEQNQVLSHFHQPPHTRTPI